MTPTKWSDLLDGALNQYIANGWVSDELSKFDFDVKYDPVNCVITHRMPLVVRRYVVTSATDDVDDTKPTGQ